MRVLVTRPQGDAELTAALLSAKGHDAIVAPLLDIRMRPGPDIALDDVQAILVTSANGVRALAHRTQRRDVKIFAVGTQTASAARALGFRNVADAAGDGAALAALVAAQLMPKAGPLLHAAGAEAHGALAELLTQKGFTLRREVLYEARAADMLPQAARYALAERRLDAVLFYSPRTARIFTGLVQAGGVRDGCREIIALCISQPTADALAPLAFRDIRVAAHPDSEALLALLD